MSDGEILPGDRVIWLRRTASGKEVETPAFVLKFNLNMVLIKYVRDTGNGYADTTTVVSANRLRAEKADFR